MLLPQWTRTQYRRYLLRGVGATGEDGQVRRKLVVLRHAKSAWPQGVPDVRRPLNERGLRDAPAVGRWLNRHVPELALVVCSPAQRTRQTWELVSQELSAHPRVVYDERLYSASARAIIVVARELPADVGTALFIAHNPGLEELVAALSGESCQLKTSSVAVLSGDGDWTDVAPGWATLAESATLRG